MKKKIACLTVATPIVAGLLFSLSSSPSITKNYEPQAVMRATPITKSVMTLTPQQTKNVALALTSTAENSTTNWKSAYSYIEDIGDGRGLTGGIVGFCSGTGDMLTLIKNYTKVHPSNSLKIWIPRLEEVMKAPYDKRPALSSKILGKPFIAAWKKEATLTAFQKMQEVERDRVYWTPALAQAKIDNVGPLGLSILYDISVNHGPGLDEESFGGIVKKAQSKTPPPARGGNETLYLTSLISTRENVLRKWGDYQKDGRTSMHRQLLSQDPTLSKRPITWTIYGDKFSYTP